MKWRVLDDNELQTEYFAFNEADGQMLTKTVYKHTVETVATNKEVQGKDVAKGEHNELWHLARIPNSVIHQWMQEDPPLNIYDKTHKERVLKRLDDPDWKYLRINTGQIGRKTMHI
tara:strand:+ start:710 stop:1057 length:348 start_codon:yes stop_codon:yes gene_type:complete